MKKLITIIYLIMLSFHGQAQLSVNGHFYGEDLFKFSRYSGYGTARSIGMGGAMSSLGGDASNAMINPAGLAFYNRSEFSISPVFINQSTSTNYINTISDLKSSKVAIGQASWISSKNGDGNRKKRATFGLSYNSLANFHNEFNYSGANNKSSLQDYFAEKANQRGANTTTLDNEFDVNTSQAETPTAMYYQAFLIDPYQDGYVVLEPSFPVNQSGRISESGSLGQINMSYAVNYNDRTYLGASLGLQNLNYNLISSHTELFPNAEAMYGFGYTDDLIVKGTGVNLTLGGIIKASEDVRLGLAVTTPTIMGIKETIVSAVKTDPVPSVIQTDFTDISTIPSDFNYRMTSPLRSNIGISYILPKKIGVLTAEAEYVGYGNMGIKDKYSNSWTSDQKRGIQAVYKDVVNLKGGGELRFGNARLRAGINYLPTALKSSDNVIKSQTVLSVGTGYRTSRFFADLAFYASKYDTGFTPYTLSNPENYASSIVTSKNNNLSFSVGTFF